MSDKFTDKSERDADDETIARLFWLAGRSESVPSEVEARVYDKVLQEWQASTVAPDSARVYRKVRREWSKTATLVRASGARRVSCIGCDRDYATGARPWQALAGGDDREDDGRC